jgi:hypothetical protein
MSDGKNLLIERRRRGLAARKLTASNESPTARHSERASRQSPSRRLRNNPLFLLALFVCYAFVIIQVQRALDSNLITLSVMFFFLRTTGLISEKNLVKILPWSHKR